MTRVAIGVGAEDTLDELMLKLAKTLGNSDFTIVIAFGDFTRINIRSIHELASQLWLSGVNTVSIDPSTIYGKLRTTGIGVNAITAELIGETLKLHCLKAMVDLVYLSDNFDQRVHWQDPRPCEAEFRYEPRFVIKCAKDHDPKSERILPYFKASTGQF